MPKFEMPECKELDDAANVVFMIGDRTNIEIN